MNRWKKMYYRKTLVRVISFLIIVLMSAAPSLIGAPSSPGSGNPHIGDAVVSYKLTASLTAAPVVANTGDTVTVSMKVTNACCNTVTGVAPSTLTVNAAGSASAVYATGPIPASKDLTAEESVTFVWTYQVFADASGGTLVFSGYASGIDSVTSETVYSPTAYSNKVSIKGTIPMSEPVSDYNKQMQPVANTNIRSAQSDLNALRDQVTTLEKKGKDTAPCKALLETADMYLKKAEEYYEKGNFIAANYWALQAIVVLEEAKKCLENL